MIMVLIIVAILAAIAGMGIVTGVQQYLFTKDTAAVSEKAQLAMARIERELVECYDCYGTSGAMPMPFHNITFGPRYMRLNSGNIEISSDNANYDKLMDQVGSFSLIYNADNSVTVTFQSSVQPGGASIPAFVTIVYPRNTPS
jgi:hypothetical protein